MGLACVVVPMRQEGTHAARNVFAYTGKNTSMGQIIVQPAVKLERWWEDGRMARGGRGRDWRGWGSGRGYSRFVRMHESAA